MADTNENFCEHPAGDQIFWQDHRFLKKPFAMFM
jgi:hypothetical protein